MFGLSSHTLGTKSKLQIYFENTIEYAIVKNSVSETVFKGRIQDNSLNERIEFKDKEGLPCVVVAVCFAETPLSHILIPFINWEIFQRVDFLYGRHFSSCGTRPSPDA